MKKLRSPTRSVTVKLQLTVERKGDSKIRSDSKILPSFRLLAILGTIGTAVRFVFSIIGDSVRTIWGSVQKIF